METLINKLKNSNNCIVITSNSIKNNLISLLSGMLINVKFKSFDEFTSDLFGKIDDKVLLQNCQKNDNIEIIKTKLDNAMLVTQDSDNPIIHELYLLNKKIKTIINDNYQNVLEYYNLHQIYIIGYDGSNDLVNKGISLLNNVEIVKMNSKSYHHTLTNFDDFQDEIIYIIGRIISLINEGVNPNKIVVNSINKDYEIKFKELLQLANLEVDFNEQIPLLNIESTKKFINDFYNNYHGKFNEDFPKYLSSFKAFSSNNVEVIKVLNVLSYFDFDIDDEYTKDVVTYLLKNHFIKLKTFDQAIRFENVFNNLYDDDTYIFIPNFNQDVVPETIKDNSYLSDTLKKEVGLITSYEHNMINKNNVCDFIKNNKFIILTSSTNSTTQTYVRNSLLSDERISSNITINKGVIDVENVNNYYLAYLKYLKAMNLYNSYHLVSEDYIKGYYTFNVQSKNQYDSSFTGINENILNRYVKPLTLSYSSIDDYAKCPFYYYVKHILKIVCKKEQTTENISLLVGIVFHYVLEKLLKIDNLCELSNEELKTKIDIYTQDKFKELEVEITPKINVYLHNLEPTLLEVVNRIINHLKTSDFETYKVEQNVEINITNDIKLRGTIDKILKLDFKKNQDVEGNYYIVIDYKTNAVEVSWKSLDEGIELQLPIYLLFVKELDPSGLIGGAYLQSILDNSLYRYKDNKTYDQLFLKRTAFKGYTNSSSSIIKSIDSEYNNENRVLPSSPFTSSGALSSSFSNFALTTEEFDQVICYTKKLVNEIGNQIQKGKFDIRPKQINAQKTSCTYCPCFMMCYHNPSHIEQIKVHNDLSFIKGDNNNEME